MMTETEMLKVCRERIATLENLASKIQDALLVVDDLSVNHLWQEIQDTLREDFRQAVITSADMTDSQRSFWLEQAKEATE